MEKTNYKAVDESGVEILIDDLDQFCADKGLSYPCMVRVANGYAHKHQGWWICHIDPELYENAKQNRKDMRMDTKKREKDEVTIMYNTETGVTVTVNRLTDFVEEYGLNKGAISMVMKGIRKSHKGWQVKGGVNE